MVNNAANTLSAADVQFTIDDLVKRSIDLDAELIVEREGSRNLEYLEVLPYYLDFIQQGTPKRAVAVTKAKDDILKRLFAPRLRQKPDLSHLTPAQRVAIIERKRAKVLSVLRTMRYQQSLMACLLPADASESDSEDDFMLRLSRPAIVLFAVALLVAAHFLFIQPSEHTPASSSKVGGRQIPRPRKAFVPSPPKSKKKTSTKGRKASKGKEPVSEDGLNIDTRGLTAYVEADGGKHPIELLIERGRRLAKAAEAHIREVKSVDDSADEYERAFGMKPPKGYDTWFKFTQSSPEPHPAPNPSLFPLVHTPFDAHLAIPANILRERVADLREKDGFFTIRFVPDGTGDEGTACTKDEEWYPELSGERGKGRVIIAGTQAWSWRCNNTLNLILPIIPNMPKEFFNMKPPLEVAFSSADGPRSIIHNSFRQRSEALGRSLKEWPKGQLLKAEQAMRWTWGWQWTCPDGAPLKKSNTDVVLNDLGAVAGLNGEQAVMAVPSKEKTFIADFAKAADFCYNPDLMQYHHSLLQDSAAGSSALVPNVAACRLVNNADIVGVPLDGVHEVVDVVDWKDKDLKKVFWRGSATGLFHSKETQWRQSQRERLHWFSHNTSDSTVSLLVDRGAGKGLVNEPWKVKDLNEAWLDVGLSGKPNQCSIADGSCDEMAREIDFMPLVRKEDATRYKFVIDVDGSRFRRLLAGNNVVLKSTLYPEWHSEMLIPWYHYVPLKLDYSDMYDILSFFMGAPDGSTAGRDDLAEEIAANALKFTEERWRMSDMQSYTYLLLLEFWRLMSDNREETSYQAEL